MQIKNKVLFDDSALLILIQQEDGCEELENVVANAVISSVNLGEVISVLARSGMPKEEITETINSSITGVIPFSQEEATLTGQLILQTKKLGLSLGDRACLATALKLGLPVYTADKAWTTLNIPNLKVYLVR